MGIFGRFMKGTMKTFVDIPSWIGLNALKLQTRTLYDGVKPLLIPRRIRETLSFEEAMAKHGVTTEIQIQMIKRSYLLYAWLFFGAALICAVYSLYWFIGGSFIVGSLTLMVSAVIFLRAFGCHFWYFELKHRKLGCTFHEWLKGEIEETK